MRSYSSFVINSAKRRSLTSSIRHFLLLLVCRSSLCFKFGTSCIHELHKSQYWGKRELRTLSSCFKIVRTVSCNKQTDENKHISKSMIHTNEMIINPLFYDFLFDFKGITCWNCNINSEYSKYYIYSFYLSMFSLIKLNLKLGFEFHICRNPGLRPQFVGILIKDGCLFKVR